MRLVLFVHSFPPVVGGGQTYQYYLADYFSRFGHDVRVVTGDQVPDSNKFPHKNFEIVKIKNFKDAAKLRVPLDSVISQAYQAVNSFNPDIVYSQGYGACLIYSMMAMEISAKHVFTYHSTPILEDEKIAGIFNEYALERSFSKFIFKHCPFDLYIANSRYYLDHALDNGVDKNLSMLSYHGIDFDLFDYKKKSNKEKWGYKKDDFVIVSPIRLIERKGILDLLDALKLINNKKVKIIIPTSRGYTLNSFEKKVLSKIKELNLEDQIKIIFDSISFFEMPEIYKMADLMVLPSHIEGLGIVLPECMAMKTPIVSTDTYGINEIVADEYNGLLAQVKNPHSLAEKIKLIMENQDLKNRLVHNGYEMVVGKYKIIDQMRQIEKGCLKLISQKK